MQLHASVPEDWCVISPGRLGQKDISAELKKSLLKNGMKGNGKVKKEEGRKKKELIYFTEEDIFLHCNSAYLYE